MKKPLFLIALFCCLSATPSWAGDRYWVLAISGSWNGTAGVNWSTTSGGAGGAAEPTAGDDVFFDANSGANTITIATTDALCRSFNATGYTGTLNINRNSASAGWVIGDGTVGHFTLGSGMTFTSTFDYSMITFASTTGTNNITTNGKSIPCRVTFDGVGGTWQFQDAFASVGNDITAVRLTNGTLNTNGKSVTVPDFRNVDSGVVSTLTLGSSTFTCTSVAAEFTMPSNNTLTANTSTIVFSDTSATNKNFNGGGKTYNLFNITGGGAGIVIVAGSSTFANLPQIVGGTKSVRFTAGTTQTYTGGTDFGNGTNVITIDTNTGGSAATLSTNQAVCANYLSIQDITGAGAGTWNVGSNSTNVSGNTGLTFSSCVTYVAGDMLQVFD